MTWDEIYKAAIDMLYGSDELKRKDEAREAVREFALNEFGQDIEAYEFESTEEYIEEYVNKYNIVFDERGNIIYHDLMNKT